MSDTDSNGAPGVEEDRRAFLKACGRFAVATPPAVTMLLSTSLTSGAIAASGGGHSGGSGSGGGGSGGGSGGPGRRHHRTIHLRDASGSDKSWVKSWNERGIVYYKFNRDGG